MKSKIISVPINDLEELIKAYDSWAGYHEPDYRELYLSRFNQLRDKINKEKENN